MRIVSVAGLLILSSLFAACAIAVPQTLAHRVPSDVLVLPSAVPSQLATPGPLQP